MGGVSGAFVAGTQLQLPLAFFLKAGSMLERSVPEGWVISGITSSESGIPQTVSYGPDTLGLPGGIVPMCQVRSAGPGPRGMI